MGFLRKTVLGTSGFVADTFDCRDGSGEGHRQETFPLLPVGSAGRGGFEERSLER